MENKEKEPLEAYISLGLLAFMTVIMFTGVVFRYVFNASLAWSEELVRYLFIWFIFISASYAVHKNAHIRVESVNKLVPLSVRKQINILGQIIWFAFSIFAGYLGITYALTLTASTSAAMNLPMTIVYFGIPIGFLLMSVRILIKVLADIKDMKQSRSGVN